jgi:hypothetical protein
VVVSIKGAEAVTVRLAKPVAGCMVCSFPSVLEVPEAAGSHYPSLLTRRNPFRVPRGVPVTEVIWW